MNILCIPKQPYDSTKLYLKGNEIVCYDVNGKFVNAYSVNEPNTYTLFTIPEQIELDWL